MTRLGRYDEARAQLHRILERDAGFVRAYQQLGIIAGMEGNVDQAVVEAERAAAMRQRGGQPWLGFAYGRAGRRADALRSWQNSRKTRPR